MTVLGHPFSVAIAADTPVTAAYTPANSNILRHQGYDGLFLFVAYTKGTADALATIQIDSYPSTASSADPTVTDPAWGPIGFFPEDPTATLSVFEAKTYTFIPAGIAGTLNNIYVPVKEIYGEYIRVKIIADNVAVTIPLCGITLFHTKK